MKRWQKQLGALIVVATCSVASLLADVKIPAIFTDHMVLQQGREVPVWGWADPGEDVTVAFGDVSVKTTTGADGRWSVTLPPLKMSREGNRLTVTGKNTVTRNDILVGEVWMCSGQSNMQWFVRQSKDANAEIAAANHPTIRLFQTKNTWNAKPQDDTDAAWQVCSPKTVENFSAVGYFFAREISNEVGVPVGMIDSSWGGTRIEPWTTPAGFRIVPALADISKSVDENLITYDNQQKPTVLYNTQIHPIVPFALRGVLWYQGEANVTDGMFYADKMRALIAGWREAFRNPKLPIYFVQLAPFAYTDRGRGPDVLPKLWEAQEKFAESDANARMVVINDIGNTKDIHPTNKQEVGRRLALLALKNNYGRTSLAAESPILEKLHRSGNELVLAFARAKSLATLDGKAPSHFEVAGTDSVFHPANATIRRTEIALTSPEVKEPLLVRYAWHETAEPNIVNEAKLPLGAFREGIAAPAAVLDTIVDMNIGTTEEVCLLDGTKVTLQLLQVDEHRDSVNHSLRGVSVKVRVNGEEVTLGSANYNLPRTVGAVQIDCPVTKAYKVSRVPEVWGLDKDARFRLWSANSPLIAPDTFGYPLRQKWFASATHMANEPVYVDRGEQQLPLVRPVSYHYGLDFGGSEEREDILAVTDGLVVSASNDTLDDQPFPPVTPGNDVVYILDDRGWYYRYSHLFRIDVKKGDRIQRGQVLGLLGKEGGSGGWSHLHMDVSCLLPSGKWGAMDAYPYLLEAYNKEYSPNLIAVARPHLIVNAGEPVQLSGERSWTRDGVLPTFSWRLSNGNTVPGCCVTTSYDKPGHYSEILQITDSQGRVDYDIAVIQVFDTSKPNESPPSIHLTYTPTLNVTPETSVTFTVRSFGSKGIGEVVDFGDGTPQVRVQSAPPVRGNRSLEKDGYAVVTHQFQHRGVFFVKATHTNERGETATAIVPVTVQ